VPESYAGLDGPVARGFSHEEAGEDHFVLDEGFIDENKGFHEIIACVMAFSVFNNI
jgi:hypothetical protein